MRRRHRWWPSRLIVGTFLMGFGIFNLVEGLVDHQILGIHHVNETVPREQWPWWDLSLLAWDAVMLMGGLALVRSGRRA